MAGGRDALGIAVRAAGAGIGPDTGSGTGSRRGHLGAIAMAQRIAAGGATGRAGLGSGAGGILVAMAGGRNGRGIFKCTISGGLPCPGIGTCGCTGSCRGGGSGVIRGVQLGQVHRGGA